MVNANDNIPRLAVVGDNRCPVTGHQKREGPSTEARSTRSATALSVTCTHIRVRDDFGPDIPLQPGEVAILSGLIDSVWDDVKAKKANED